VVTVLARIPGCSDKCWTPFLFCHESLLTLGIGRSLYSLSLFPYSPMSTVSLSKPAILARLLEIHTARLTLDREEADLWARLQKPKGDKGRNVPLTFGKNTITWGDGQVLYIKGKGYQFLKALYFSKGMRLTVAKLGKMVWGNEVLNHRSFTRYVLWLSEKLEKAQFPYRLLPAKSKERVETIEKPESGKPVKKRIQSEIVGIRLCEK